jgi:hypothetical protein
VIPAHTLTQHPYTLRMRAQFRCVSHMYASTKCSFAHAPGWHGKGPLWHGGITPVELEQYYLSQVG